MTTSNEILLRPAVIYAFLKILPLIFLALVFLLLAWELSPYFLLISIAILGAAWYRLLFIRSFSFVITPEVIRLQRGIFFKRTDQLEMYRIKDYIIVQPFGLRIFALMNLILKSTDPENPVICLTGIPESAIVDTIRDHVQEARRHNNIYEIN
jgi:uncharacterized membrane protein YdbT with pleckstrin-like domain